MKLVGILIIATIVLIDALCVLVVLGGNNLDEDYDYNNDSSLSINNKNQEHNE